MRAAALLIGLVPVALGVNVENVKNPDHNIRATWGYTAANGPATWPTTYATCAGTAQSPIDIVTSSASSADPGKIMLGGYDGAMMGTITNNEHTITFTYDSGPQPYVYGGRLPAGDRYEFLQLHWHWGSVNSQGSEHTMDGKMYPAELHLVHWNTKYGTVADAVTKNDGLAVLGFFYEVSSSDNGNLDDMLSVVNQVRRQQRALNLKNKVKKGNKRQSGRQALPTVAVPASVRLDQLLPSTGLPEEYYYYMGSLTTPTCDEVVQWTVFPTTVPISEAQLNIFRALEDSNSVTLNDNYRPPQPLNGRTVYKRSASGSSTSTSASADIQAATLSGAVVASVVTALAFGLILPALNAPTRRRSLELQSDGTFRRSQPSPAVFSGEWINNILG